MEGVGDTELDTSWFSEARCKGADVSAFFPDPEEPQFRNIQKVAEAICNECPVIIKCAEYALYSNEKNGTWGGKSSWGTSSWPEREKYVRRLKLKAEYNRLQELPDSRRKRMLIKDVSLQLSSLRNIHGS